MVEKVMLMIEDKETADSVADLPIVDAYMRWTLDAAEEILGKEIVEEILTDAKLPQLIGNYPESTLTISNTMVLKDYANLSTAIVKHCGDEGQDKVVKIGQIAAQPALDNQGKLFSFAARNAIKLLPMSTQIKTVLDSVKSDVEKVYGPAGYSTDLTLEDRGDKWAYIDEGCALCAGKTSNQPICGIWTGTLEESLTWLTRKVFKVEQVSCRSMGDSACVWEVNKTPC